jgi:tight adherence protein B
MRQDELLSFALLAIGLSTVIAAVFWFVYSRYPEWEVKVKEGMADYAAELYDLFDRMFQRQTLNRCYTFILVSTVAFGFFFFVMGLAFSFLGGLIGGVLGGFFGFRFPGIIIRFLFGRRIAKFDAQLIDALNMMANAIRSGLSFMQVIQILEKEMPSPAKEEFAMVLKENRVGVNLNDALLNMTKRVPSDDLFMIMNSVVTLSQQGGDLSEAFETIAVTIRERQRVLGKIRTMAQAGMTQATILASLPFVMMIMLYFIQPDFILLLFTTPLGLGMIVGMLIFIALGVLWMKKILTIDV